MQTRSSVVILLVIFNVSFFVAQNEFSKWYFGQQAGLDFATQPPTVLTNGLLNAPEGVATISDAMGNLLFYTDGIGIVNSASSAMANGTGLLGYSSSTQAVLILKQPGSNTLYYVVTTSPGTGTVGVRYSIVDMSLAAGQGSVVTKNTLLYTPTCEKQVAVRHCNGKDIWLVTHDYGTNQIRSFLLTSAGFSALQVVSAIGEAPTNGSGGISAIGHLKISPDGRKLAMATAGASNPPSLGSGGFFLFDFDPASGIVSNSLTLLSGSNLTMGAGAYGLEFSADGTKLYGTTSPSAANYTCSLYQWDICAPTLSAIVQSQFSLSISSSTLSFGALQRAIDGKIYIAMGPTSPSLSVISSPNSSGVSMNFLFCGLDISPGYSRLGLPNFINPWTKPATPPFTSTIACQKVSFDVPPVPTFSSGCTSAPYSPSAYLWNFGEPASGSANTSSLSNPVHTYSTTGNFTVSLILYSNCSNDTLRQVVAVTTPGPTLNIAGNFLICKGAKATYTATGGSSYAWSNNTAGPTATLSPTVTTVYTATAMLNGCQQSRQFTVTVDPCLTVAGVARQTPFLVYPNPVNEKLNIDCEQRTTVVLTDINGHVIHHVELEKGKQEVNVSGLPKGIYLLRLQVGQELYHSRFVKIGD